MDDKKALKILGKIFKTEPKLIDLTLTSAYLSENKWQILELLRKEGSLNITQIQQRMDLAYKNVQAHIKKLEERGLVTTKKQEKQRGREVIVSSNLDDVKKYLEEMEFLRKWAIKLRQN